MGFLDLLVSARMFRANIRSAKVEKLRCTLFGYWKDLCARTRTVAQVQAAQGRLRHERIVSIGLKLHARERTILRTFANVCDALHVTLSLWLPEFSITQDCSKQINVEFRKTQIFKNVSKTFANV